MNHLNEIVTLHCSKCGAPTKHCRQALIDANGLFGELYECRMGPQTVTVCLDTTGPICEKCAQWEVFRAVLEWGQRVNGIVVIEGVEPELRPSIFARIATWLQKLNPLHSQKDG